MNFLHFVSLRRIRLYCAILVILYFVFCFIKGIEYIYFFNIISSTDERRRGGRNRTPDDNRRHTLSNDMMVYAQQNQNQLRSLDLEVNSFSFSIYRRTSKYYSTHRQISIAIGKVAFIFLPFAFNNPTL